MSDDDELIGQGPCTVCGREFKDDPAPPERMIRRSYFVAVFEHFPDDEGKAGNETTVDACSSECFELWVQAHSADRAADEAGWLA